MNNLELHVKEYVAKIDGSLMENWFGYNDIV
jgi:hypothetical protein